jgi:hypothetical protein
MFAIGCSGETSDTSANSGGYTNGGANTAGSDNGGSNTGGVVNGGSDNGGAVEKPVDIPIEKPPVVKPPIVKEPVCERYNVTTSQGSERLNSTMCFVTSDYTCNGFYNEVNDYIVHCKDSAENWCQAVPLDNSSGVFVCGAYGQEYGEEIGIITQANDGKYHLTSDNKLLATCAVMGDVMTVCEM